VSTCFESSQESIETNKRLLHACLWKRKAKESEDDDGSYDDDDDKVIWATASWTFMSSLAILVV